MKNYCLLLIIGFIVAFFGCQSGNQMNSSDLEVTEQIDSILGGHDENNYCWVSFNVDVPVKGSKALKDSVIAFINKQLYDACEGCVHINDHITSYKPKEVFTDNAENLLKHYMDKYKTLITDSIWKVYGCELKMEAQTKKYVTFGVEHFHCGASCGSEKYYYTFDKSDGHLVKDIISHDNLVRFFEDYPEYNNLEADPWSGEAGWKFSADYEFSNSYNGLLDDHFSLAIQGCGNHYLLLNFPYGQIFSYLSSEAQALVERHEENEPMLPAYLSYRNPEVNLEVDTSNYALIGCVSVAGGEIRIHCCTMLLRRKSIRN